MSIWPNNPSLRPVGPRLLIIACGALARELNMLRRADCRMVFDVTYVPAILHNRPEHIASAVKARIDAVRGRYHRIFCAYGDCGTGGALDELLRAEGIDRLPGAHCYEFIAGSQPFFALMSEEIGSFFLTDYLARHFERLVWQGLGLDRHPGLRYDYFAHYRRVVHLVQAPDKAVSDKAADAARKLALPLKTIFTGLELLSSHLEAASIASPHG